MEKTKANRIIIAWLLSATFLLPIIVRNTHVYHHHNYQENEPYSHSSGHDCNSCAVCNFSFYSFIETEPLYISSPITEVFCILSDNYKEKIYNQITSLYYLRGPQRI